MNKEQYLLIKLMEECAEVQHACAKALRFGLDNKWEEKGVSNRENILDEFIDIMVTFDMMITEKMFKDDIAPEEIVVDLRKDKALHYMQYSRKLGILDEDTL